MAGEKIVVVGTGEQAELAYEYFTHDSPHEVAGFSVGSEFMDRKELFGLPVTPFEEITERYDQDEYRAFVAISSTQLNRIRKRMFEEVKRLGYECISYVSSHAFKWHDVEIGENSFVFENNVLQYGVSVGDNVILWSGNHVGHQTKIEDHCFVTSHVVISGFCTIGSGSFLGVNSCFADKLNVGHDCVVGAGAVVVKDTEPRKVYVGNPAKALDRDSFETFGVQEARD
jgi:sugar O-acyltransferase (sialic acid O-acetyltransferase NeuD family)